MRTNLTRRIQHTLYMLRREYGGPISVYKLLSSESDPQTGDKVIDAESYPVDLAVILPATLSLQEKRGISLISANKQMVQGGHYEGVTQKFIIDRCDLPEGITLTTDDWIVESERRFDIAAVEEFEDGSAYLIHGKAQTGRPANQIFHVQAESLLSVVGDGRTSEFILSASPESQITLTSTATGTL